MIKFGQKTITFPHGYGYCQCGCGMKTVKLRNDIYANPRKSEPWMGSDAWEWAARSSYDGLSDSGATGMVARRMR